MTFISTEARTGWAATFRGVAAAALCAGLLALWGAESSAAAAVAHAPSSDRFMEADSDAELTPMSLLVLSEAGLAPPAEASPVPHPGSEPECGLLMLWPAAFTGPPMSPEEVMRLADSVGRPAPLPGSDARPEDAPGRAHNGERPRHDHLAAGAEPSGAVVLRAASSEASAERSPGTDANATAASRPVSRAAHLPELVLDPRDF